LVEILVHYAGVPKGMMLSRIEIPDDVSITEVPSHLLTGDWARDLEQTRSIGSSWFTKQMSAVLIVPSCVVHGENNYLLNTLHQDCGRIRFNTLGSFEFDPRLK
jgi:RES domain-containing protein